jgi:WD40 repeat protein
MPIATRTFRVFVSSTFEDLKQERDLLQREVFPKLRTLCEKHGARFQAIDLRWGVRDEAALDQQTMEICLREIRRCQATGVKPNFIVLLGDRYGWQPLPARIPATEWKALAPHLPALAEQWYRLDENAVPAEYCLQPRTGEFVDPAAWNPVEQTLREALAKAARAAELPGSRLIQYGASATHQEILAADQEHVFAFVRPSTTNTDPRVEDLKSHLQVHPFNLGVVYDQLRQVIEAEVKRFEDRPALDLEVEAHDRFAEDRCRIFTGRQAVLDTIADYIRGPERRPLVLHGESGSGKSAVMAKASEQYQGPGRMIRRFIGASPESASGHALLTSLCRQLAPGETPVDYAQLENAFKERLKGELVLFIDALDQLAAGDPAREATWLPEELPPGVKVIVSTTDDVSGLRVQLEPMTQSEGGQALDEWLQEARRTLQPWQRETVLAHFERCGLPLYLKLAAEESKLWKSYTPEDACTLGEGVAGVIDTLFDRLASNANHGPVLVERSLGYLAAARYGLTEDEVLDVLTADDTVWSDFDQRKHHEVSERSLPVVVWSRLSLDLEPSLTERAAPGGTVIAFYHRQLAERAAAWSQDRHSDLARYFSGRPVSDTRRLVELPFQQRAAQQWREAEATLFDCRFLFAKVAAGMALDLDADYQALLREGPETSHALRLIHGALQLSMHEVAQDPAQFAPQMVGRLLMYLDKPDVAKFVDEIAVAAPRPWLRPLHPCFDAPGGALIRTLAGHSMWVVGVAVTPDGQRAVSASDDSTLKVWDLETGRTLRTLEGHSGIVYGVAVTPDGKRAVSASSDKTLKVWDLETGRALRTLEGHSDSVDGVAVTPDGKRAVSASSDKTLKVWDLETGALLRTLEGHSGWVHGVAVTPDGKRAVSASYDNTLKVWDLETGRALRTLEGHSSAVLGVAVTPDGKRAVSASDDKTLKVWDLETGRALRTLEGHRGPVYGVAVTPDGKRAISASWDNTLRVWDLETGRALRTIEAHSEWVNGVAVTPDGKRAVSASTDMTLKVWDLESDRASRTLEGHSSWVCGVAVTPDGKRAVSASLDHTLKVWDLETGRALRTLEGHSGIVYGVAVTPDGKRAVSASMDKTLKVWDLHAGRALRTLEGHSGWVHCVAVTPDGKRAVSASYDNTLKVWDLETGRALRTLEGHPDRVNGVAVTPDGKRAVSASTDMTLKVWDLETGAAPRTLKGHSGAVLGVALTADGKRAVSASADATLRVWDLETGRALRTIEAHSEWVSGVAVTPDGRRAVSAYADRTLKAYADRTLRVWDLETGVVIATFRCDAPAGCCAFADGRRIVAGNEGGRVYLLELEE